MQHVILVIDLSAKHYLKPEFAQVGQEVLIMTAND